MAGAPPANRHAKGGRREGSGRKKGGKNAIRFEIKASLAAAAREHGPKALKNLVSIMNNAKAPESCRISAAIAVIERGYGKPMQPMQHTDVPLDLTKLSDEEFAVVERIYSRIAAVDPGKRADGSPAPLGTAGPEDNGRVH